MADRVLACDLHSGQAMGYFDIFVDHVYGQPVILDYLASKMISPGDLVVVSPDVGGVACARGFAKKLCDAPLAIVDKRRRGHNMSEVQQKLQLCIEEQAWWLQKLLGEQQKASDSLACSYDSPSTESQPPTSDLHISPSSKPHPPSSPELAKSKENVSATSPVPQEEIG